MEKCFVTVKSGIKRLGFIENYTTYGNELKNLISDEFSYNDLDTFIDSEVENGRVYYYDKYFGPVAEESSEKRYKLINTGYRAADNNQSIYVGFEMKKTWCGAVFGTQKSIFSGWEKENSDENIYNNIFFRNIFALSMILNKLTDKEYSEEDTRILIEAAYKRASATNEIYVHSSASGKKLLYFDSGIEANDGKKIWLASEPNEKKDARQQWFGLFFVKQTRLIQWIFDLNCFNISGLMFDDMSQANAFLGELADKAIKESWSAYSTECGSYELPQLKCYIENTYSRLCKEAETKSGKMVEKDDFVYFNSGLLDRFYRQIFIRGREQSKVIDIKGIGESMGTFLSELKIYSENDAVISAALTPEQYPQIASYCDDYRDLIFDSSLEIKLQDRHVFEDGVRRNRLPKYAEAYENCKDDVEYDRLMADISRDFESAIKRMLLLAKRNYTIAVPQYVKKYDEIQFMLPLYLETGKDIPDCVLSLQFVKDGATPYYRGTTILTPEMAVGNARQISGPEFHWIDRIKTA